ncbi:hypothetical protein LCGC14_1742800 [marine sediment metagenome]|uniref:Major tropism determinant N-terminal domain-containing protein n=1 Tax=marine sediment metagenome TaxID=412755 RepID=A0A0F9H670_9ZZZZ
MSLRVDRRLIWAQNAVETIYAHNKSSASVAPGDVVILDTADSTATEVAFATTTTADNKLVLGMAIENIANNAYGLIQTKGPTGILKVDGTTDIAVGDHIGSFTTAKIGQKATGGRGGAFAIALEAYATNDSSGVIDAWLTGSAARIDTSSNSASFVSPTFSGTVSVQGATTFNSTATITIDGSASATDALTLTLGDILISDGHLDIVEANGTTDVLTLTHTTGVMASDEATLKIIEGGDIASGGNMLRLNPTGTPNAASILLELVGAGKIGQALYIDEDPTGIDVVHFHGGGAMTDGFAVLGITNDGNLATGGSLLNLTLGGTPASTAVRVLEIDGQKDAIAVYIDSDAATESAVQITGNGVVADNKAMLDVTNIAAIAAGSSLVRIHSTAASAGATAYGLEIACDATNLEALYVSLGESVFVENVTIEGTSKLYFRDTSQYVYASADNTIDIVAPTKFHVDGPTDFGESGGSNAHDVIFYLATNAATIKVDNANDILILDQADIQLGDTDILTFGDGAGVAGDIKFQFTDGTGLVLLGTATAENFLMGDDTYALNTTLKGTLTVGKDNTGYDVKLWGATAASFMLWDESEDQLKITSAADSYVVDIIGDKAAASQAVMRITATSTTGTNTCLELDQDDDNIGFLTITGTEGSGNSIETTSKSGGTSRFLLIDLNGSAAWIQIYK